MGDLIAQAGPIVQFLAVFAIAIKLTQSTTDGIGNEGVFQRVPNLYIALGLGTIYSWIIYQGGFVPLPDGVVGWRANLVVVGTGLLTAGAAKVWNDKRNPSKKEGPEVRAAIRREGKIRRKLPR